MAMTGRTMWISISPSSFVSIPDAGNIGKSYAKIRSKLFEKDKQKDEKIKKGNAIENIKITSWKRTIGRQYDSRDYHQYVMDQGGYPYHI